MLGENIFKDIVKRSAIFLIVGIIVIIAVTSIKSIDPKPYIYGLAFGVIINVLNFRLMSLSIKKSLKLNLGTAQKYTVGNYLVRYVIYGIVLYIAAVADYIDLLSVIVGFFTVKLIIITDNFYEVFKSKKK